MPEHIESQIDHLKTPSCHILLLLTSLDSSPRSEIKRWIWNGATSTGLEGTDAILENEWKSSASRLGCRERCYIVLVVEGDIKVLHNQTADFSDWSSCRSYMPRHTWNDNVLTSFSSISWFYTAGLNKFHCGWSRKQGRLSSMSPAAWFAKGWKS